MISLSKIYKLLIICGSVVALPSCDEDTNIGSSLVGTEGVITIESNFSLSGHSTPIDAVQSRSVVQLIGNIDAEGYGKFYSDFVTQYMPAASIDSTLTSAQQIDGFRLLLAHNAGQFVGDSIVPMGIEVYRLTKDLEAPIYSSLNPDSYYNPGDLLASKTYTSSNSELPDTLADLSYREVLVDLPRELGVELFELYQQDPQAYLNPQEFCRTFKGLYVKSSFGSGRVTRMGASVLQMLYHQDTINSAGRDTTYNYVGNFYAVSPEIITNNNIRYEMSPALEQRINNGEPLIVAPAGQEVEFEFPIEKIIESYRKGSGNLSVLNDLTLSIPTQSISNDYNINPPANVLLVLKEKKKEFFQKSKVNDNITSFYSTYNTKTGEYDFSSMRTYMLDMMSKESLTKNDYTFVVTPVTVRTETTGSAYYGNQMTIVTAITPYIEQPAMVRLNLENAKIVLTYTNQNKKN